MSTHLLDHFSILKGCKRSVVPPVKNILPKASCDFLGRRRHGHHIEMASTY